MSKLKVSLHTRALVMQANSGLSNMYDFHAETPKLINSVSTSYAEDSKRKKRRVRKKPQLLNLLSTGIASQLQQLRDKHQEADQENVAKKQIDQRK